LYAAEPDRAVFAVIRSSASDIDHVQVIARVAVDAELDLVVVERATAKDVVLSCTPERAGPGSKLRLWKDHALHRFFVDQSTDGRLQVSESVFGK
jgi:hypothetical protein